MTDSPEELVVIGCYTAGAGGDGDGLVTARRDPVSGDLTMIGMAGRTPAPSFVVRHPRLPMVYAVGEQEAGSVTAWELSPAGDLTARGTWPTGGAFPCHLAIAGTSSDGTSSDGTSSDGTSSDGTSSDGNSSGGQWLAVANYGSGSVAALPLDEHGVPDGRLAVTVHTGHGPVRDRQEGPHAHMVIPVRDGVLAIDLGIDRILRHPYEQNSGRFGQPVQTAVPAPGTGPRHLVHDRAGRIHVVGELDPAVTTFDPAQEPWQSLSRVRTTTGEAAQPSEIDISADGRFLYVGNRGPDTIAVLSLDGPVPRLVAEVPCGGTWPRHFTVSGSHLYVANERSNQIAVFRLDPDTGVPEPTSGGLRTPTPTCVQL